MSGLAILVHARRHPPFRDGARADAGPAYLGRRPSPYGSSRGVSPASVRGVGEGGAGPWLAGRRRLPAYFRGQGSRPGHTSAHRPLQGPARIGVYPHPIREPSGQQELGSQFAQLLVVAVLHVRVRPAVGEQQ